MIFLEKIRTYLVITDENNFYGSSTGSPIQSYVYEIEQFVHSDLMRTYNATTFMSNKKELTLFVNRGLFQRKIENIIDLYTNPEKNNFQFTIVKFWGNVNQEFTFSGTKLLSQEGDTFKFTFTDTSFSQKNEDHKKWSGILIPFIRDDKLNRILGSYI